jgi:hypothetical protein
VWDEGRVEGLISRDISKKDGSGESIEGRLPVEISARAGDHHGNLFI